MPVTTALHCSVPGCTSEVLDQHEPVRLVSHGLRSNRTSPLCAERYAAKTKRSILCGDWYATLSHARLNLCSLRCERHYRNTLRRKRAQLDFCAECDSEYPVTSGNHRYCSAACKQRAYRRRRVA